MSSKNEIVKLVQRALPHDFGATLTFIAWRAEDLETIMLPLLKLAPNVKLEQRRAKILLYVKDIENSFAQFWKRHQNVDNFATMEKEFELVFFPKFERIETEANTISRILNRVVSPKTTNTKSTSYIALADTLRILERISYFCNRSRYYIGGMKQLIDFDNFRAGQDTNLNKLIALQEELIGTIFEDDVDLNVKVVGKLPTLKMDYSHTFILFSNLFKNSIKYRRGDECNITIIYDFGQHTKLHRMDEKKFEVVELRGKLDTKWISIHFLDQGVGIKKKNLKGVFKPFKRAVDKDDEDRLEKALRKRSAKHRSMNLDIKYSGLGIGLAIVKRVVEMYGGTVEAKSHYGENTCISIHLPSNLLI